MSRQLLNSLPDWALALIFVAVAVIIGLAMLWILHRFAPKWRDEPSGGTVVGVASMVMTLFALVFAFVIVNLYSAYESARADVNSEANSLSELTTAFHAFPEPARHTLDAAIARYVREVQTREFGLLKNGEIDRTAQMDLNNVFLVLERYASGPNGQMHFYSTASDALTSVATERNDRLDAAEGSIPQPLLGLMLFLAVLVLLTTALVTTRNFGLDVLMCVLVAAVVGAGMVTAAILEYPFSGSVAVSSSPFDRADLAAIVRANP